MVNSINCFDYFKVIEILNPFKKRLEIIYQAAINDEFEVEDLDYSDPYKVLRYYLDSNAYEKYQIQDLALELKEKLKGLDKKDYCFDDLLRIEEKYGMDIPHEFDYRWTLEDVYKYLLGLIDSEGLVIVESSIINGEILGIFNCFIIRV